MRDRIEILKDLIKLNGDISYLQDELAQHEWDAKEPLIVVKVKDLDNILKRFDDNSISSIIVEDWANSIEVRDDIAFENDGLKEAIHELANPELFGQINKDKIISLVTRLA